MSDDEERPLNILSNTNSPKVESKSKVQNLLNLLKPANARNEPEKLKPFSSIIPTTRGFGNREQPDEKALEEKEKERLNYLPFNQRKRGEEENFKYVKQKEKIESKIKRDNSSISIDTLDQLHLNSVKKDEDYCDDFDLKIYNDPKFNFFGNIYDERLPIFEIKDQVCLPGKKKIIFSFN